MPKKAPGPNGEVLPPGLYWDRRYYRIQPLPGWPRKRAGTNKAAALRELAQMRAQLRSGNYQPKARRVKDLDDLAKRWRESEDPDDMPSLRANYNQYRFHVSPRLGKRDPGSVEPPELLQVLIDVYKLTGLSAASVHNLRGTVNRIYEFGRFHGLCDDNPCSRIPKGMLPSKRKQKRPCYSDVEAFRLMSEGAVPHPWRVFYALAGLAGMRSGEVAGLRWGDWDNIAGSLFVHCQYQGRPLKTARGDDTKERMVPVHVELTGILAEWRLAWAQHYGRFPTDDDFTVPDARNLKALTTGIISKRAPRDCAALGIPNKGMHGLRRFHITYARAGGARKEDVERYTHNSAGDIIDTYTSQDVWPALQRAVACLKVTWPSEDNVVQLRVAASGGTDKPTDNKTGEAENLSEREPLLAPAIGLEPMTKRLTVARSTN